MEGGVISEVGVGQLFGLFNIVAGLLLVAARLTLGAGLVSYFGRLALAKRDESLITMQWGVRLMFVLVWSLCSFIPRSYSSCSRSRSLSDLYIPL